MDEIKCTYMNRKDYDDYYCKKVRHNVPYEVYIKLNINIQNVLIIQLVIFQLQYVMN